MPNHPNNFPRHASMLFFETNKFVYGFTPLPFFPPISEKPRFRDESHSVQGCVSFFKDLTTSTCVSFVASLSCLSGFIKCIVAGCVHRAWPLGNHVNSLLSSVRADSPASRTECSSWENGPQIDRESFPNGSQLPQSPAL